jgi:hypothetical protein
MLAGEYVAAACLEKRKAAEKQGDKSFFDKMAAAVFHLRILPPNIDTSGVYTFGYDPRLKIGNISALLYIIIRYSSVFRAESRSFRAYISG